MLLEQVMMPLSLEKYVEIIITIDLRKKWL